MRVLFGALLFLLAVAAMLGAIAVAVAAIARAVTTMARLIREALLVFGRIVLATLVACGFALVASFATASFRSADSAIDPAVVLLIATLVIWVITFGVLQWNPASANAFEASSPARTRSASTDNSRSHQRTTPALRSLKDRQLQGVWTRLQPLVGWRGESIRSALVKCDDFAARAAGAPQEHSLVDWAFVVRRIPELVKAVLENMEAATDSKRSELLDDLNDDLQQIAMEAEIRLHGVDGTRKTRLAIIRRYVASRTGAKRDAFD